MKPAQLVPFLAILVLAGLGALFWLAVMPVRAMAMSCGATLLIADYPEGAPQSTPVGAFIDQVISGIWRAPNSEVIIAADELGTAQIWGDDVITLTTFSSSGQLIGELTWQFSTPDRKEIEAKPPQVVSQLFPVDELVSVHISVRDLYPPHHSVSPLYLVFRSLDPSACAVLGTPVARTATPTIMPTPLASAADIEDAPASAQLATPTKPAVLALAPTPTISERTKPTAPALPTTPATETSPGASMVMPHEQDTHARSLHLLILGGVGLLGLLVGSYVLYRRRSPRRLTDRPVIELELTSYGRSRQITPFSRSDDVQPYPQAPLHGLIFADLGLRAETRVDGVAVVPIAGPWEGWSCGPRELSGSEPIVLTAGDAIEHAGRGIRLAVPADRRPAIFTPFRADQPLGLPSRRAPSLKEPTHGRFTIER